MAKPLFCKGKWKFENGEAMASDGAVLVFEPDIPQQRLEVEFEIFLDNLPGVSATLGSYNLWLATETGGLSQITGNMGRTVARAVVQQLACGSWQKVKMTFGPDGISIGAAGKKPLRGNDPALSLFIQDATIHGQGGMRLRNIVARGEPLPPSGQVRLNPHRKFLIGTTIDFAMDILLGKRPWEEKDLRHVVRELNRLGMQRIYWIDNGDWSNGKWQDLALTWNVRDKFENTFAQMPDPLRIVADEVHRCGMTAYAIIKPYDFGNNLYYLPDDPARWPSAYRPLRQVGGYAACVMSFLRNHPELLMRRHPYGTEQELQEKAIRKIKIFSRDETAFRFALSDLKLLVSNDNVSYRPYIGKIQLEENIEERAEVIWHWAGNRSGVEKRRIRVITIGGLDIKEKYFAVSFAGSHHGLFLINRLAAFAELFDENGAQIPFTLGIQSKREVQQSGDGFKFLKGSLERSGVNYGFQWGIPFFQADSFGMDSLWPVDLQNNFLAFCRGKNQHACALSYAHQESRDFLLSFLGRTLATGIDGVDLRLNSHCSTFEPQAYGFNPPVVEEFKRRYGKDVLRDDFDWFEWQKLQGEFVTRLMRDASALVRAAGRKFQVHLGYYNTLTDRQMAYLNTYFDWKTWLQEGLVDEITHKDNPLESPLCRQVRDLSAKMNLPFYECRRHWGGRPGENWAALQGRIGRRAREFGMDGLILYENCELMILGDKPGTIKILMPEIAETIRSLRN